MNKIERVYEIIKNRLPKSYVIPIKIYKNTQTLIKAYAKKNGDNYKELIEYYSKTFKPSNYVNSKYGYHIFEKHKIKAFNISALATKPISISRENVEPRKKISIMFLLLHEIGHFILKSSNEKLVDRFAIRWIKKFIKEGLIK